MNFVTPQKADRDFFLNKVVTNIRGEQLKLEDALASKLLFTMIRNGYVDDQFHLTDDYFAAVEKQNIKLPEELSDYQESLMELVKSIYMAGQANMTDNERNRNIPSIAVNSNFHKQEFQELWNRINRKSVYTVQFNSDELIRKCIRALETKLQVPAVRYMIAHGELSKIQSKEQLRSGEAFETRETKMEFTHSETTYHIKYDLIGKLMDETRLTRKTIVAILAGVKEATFLLFRMNPEEFIMRAAKLINEQKASTVIESITYDVLNDTFEADIFMKNTLSGQFGQNAIPAEKHIYDYVVTDSKIERAFAKELDVSNEVRVYAKLPRGFFIPTPVGKYNPDWAIVFKEGGVKHIYFIAETKGTMDSMELREVEKAKIECARKHFAKLNTGQLKYDVVNNYEKLLELVKG